MHRKEVEIREVLGGYIIDTKANEETSFESFVHQTHVCENSAKLINIILEFYDPSAKRAFEEFLQETKNG